MPDVVVCVVWQSLTCEVEVIVDIAVVVVNAGGVVIVACCCWAVRWVLRMLTHHTLMFRTESVTELSPTQTGTGTLQGNFFAPIPVPVAPVSIYPCGNLFPCPSLGQGMGCGAHLQTCINFFFLNSVLLLTMRQPQLTAAMDSDMVEQEWWAEPRNDDEVRGWAPWPIPKNCTFSFKNSILLLTNSTHSSTMGHEAEGPNTQLCPPSLETWDEGAQHTPPLSFRFHDFQGGKGVPTFLNMLISGFLMW